MSNTLKPCPFCGGTRPVHTFRGKLLCSQCGAEGPRGRDARECESAWNERVGGTDNEN